MGEWDDMDLASGGPVLVASLNLVLGAGKDGVLYVLAQDDMGRTTQADLIQPAGLCEGSASSTSSLSPAR